jgi:AcrR family transcriptional regulator
MKSISPSPKSKPKKPYHHGNLVEALIAGAIDIIEKQGVERLSVREVAKRAGVSPGAPFQHFASKEALLTAVAEQAMNRLTQAALEAEAEVDEEDSLSRLEAIGRGYLHWAFSNPTHFEVITSRKLIDVQSSPSLQAQNEAIRIRMVNLLNEAQARNELAPGLAIDNVVLSCRALVYGLARMAVDGHFPEWHPSEAPAVAAKQALHAFIDGMRFKR